MTSYVTHVYDENHPDFEQLSVFSYTPGFVGASWDNAFEQIAKLEVENNELKQRLAQYE
ncbi:hypothetical protein LVJ82_17175 [Vitreoscilla massiliensis]|uniref:Uncharacterized protein n=1 Tax=Vitreoscilla massiliensis TaxID=1689272 RepID=A0ABY4E044_9NEIS|nr:hypothetical protein [Vitreoscilla massiliensis]UOO89152.1 hypothetical protein LVJ82_17175 [Vitreoscilla massiliensis]